MSMKIITFERKFEDIVSDIISNMQIVSKLAMCLIKMRNNEKYGFRGKFSL